MAVLGLLASPAAMAATAPGAAQLPSAAPAPTVHHIYHRSRHHSHRTHHGPVVAAKPPAPIAPGFAAAPVPNEAVTPPPDHQNPEASVAPGIMQLHYPPVGEGYVHGSSPQAMDDRNTAKAAGVEVSVPIK